VQLVESNENNQQLYFQFPQDYEKVKVLILLQRLTERQIEIISLLFLGLQKYLKKEETSLFYEEPLIPSQRELGK
jgi:hypothetical protein